MSGSLLAGTSHPPTVDMRGKVVVVTGGNSGIGYATAKALAVLGAHIILACRSEQRALAAIHRMKGETCTDGDGRRSILVEYMYLDLASLDSVRRFCSTIRDRDQSLDILINNAGISWAHYGLTEDGFEQHYQRGRVTARVVFVASRRHAQGVFDPKNINGEISYSRYAFYNHSKLYNTDTEMSRNMADMAVMSVFAKALKAFSIGWRSAEKGAATSLYVATEPGLNSQQCHYYSDCRVRHSSPLSRREELRQLSVIEVDPTHTSRSHAHPKQISSQGLAVKEYVRAGAGHHVPSPDDLRPLGTLVQTMDYLMNRCDDNNARIGDKMIYASTKDNIKKQFSGIGLEFQANDRGDMDYDTFAAEVVKKA
ncbi:Retinol dehydrogenase 14 [Geodia barretti]|uniref:Retinol dehydrogenase 14 n=1 Tax=Geodia barretti TaxID=519541 RepID=A0AA35XDA7_GEOBA|nr:Retinol dehydrogenase 14 [Geodia barretti]